MSYNNYSVYDFVMDESFKKWVKYPESEEDLHWEEWILENPDKRGLISEAHQIILFMDFETHHLSKSAVNSLWQKLDQRIEEREQGLSIKKPSSNKISTQAFSHYRRLAAVFVGLMVFSATLFFVLQHNNTTTYVTQYGETRILLLPDSSTVTLNANSTLKHNSDWYGDEVREVWLQGEAFFSVVHTRDHQKFIVNTSDLDVEVLGTEFNVNNRRGGTKVVLNSGKVKLSLPSVPTNGETDKKVKEIIMKPGELVEYSEEDKKTTKEVVDAEKYTAWRENKLIFEDTPVSEIVQVLEDNYGLEVIIKDSALASRKFTATYPADNVDILLKALSKTFNIKISKTENQVVFEDNIP
jgi:ferric-dicitrate binding protein FerR (iron transport regulator)